MKKRPFLSIHNHSINSTRDGLNRIPDLVETCANHGMSFTLTDHHSTAGYFELYESCRKHGVTPVFGNEVYINRHRDRVFELRDLKKTEKDPDKKREISYEFEEKKKYRHLLLLAKNQEGFKNLLWLSNQGFEKFYEKPLITYQDLFAIPKSERNMIATSGCISSESSIYIINEQYDDCEEYIEQMQEEFGNDFYLELQVNDLESQKRVNDKLREYHKKYKIPMVIANDSHYLDKSYSRAHQLFLLLQGKQKVYDIGKKQWRFRFENNKGELRRKKVDKGAEFAKDVSADTIQPGQRIRQGEVMEEGDARKHDYLILSKEEVDKVWIIEGADLNFLPEEQLREKIAKEHPDLNDIIDEMIENNKDILEKIENVEIDSIDKLPQIENADEKLREKVFKGLMAKGMADRQECIERAEYELGIISANKFSNYFLILADSLDWCRANNIPIGPGRGSAAACYIAYLIDIHAIDSIKYGLRFERFLSLERMKNLVVVELEDGTKIEIEEKDEVQLVNGNTILAQELTSDHEIQF